MIRLGKNKSREYKESGKKVFSIKKMLRTQKIYFQNYKK